ncbi:MAG: response regulator [Longimicrobiales bacterium]
MHKRILIVEQDDAVRKQARDALEAAGLEVLDADLGRQGVYLAERRQPDAILVGMELSDINGPRILRELRANPSTRDIPVVFLITPDAPVPAGDGVAGAITLPLDTSALPSQVSDLFGWQDEQSA